MGKTSKIWILNRPSNTALYVDGTAGKPFRIRGGKQRQIQAATHIEIQGCGRGQTDRAGKVDLSGLARQRDSRERQTIRIEVERERFCRAQGAVLESSFGGFNTAFPTRLANIGDQSRQVRTPRSDDRAFREGGYSL